MKLETNCLRLLKTNILFVNIKKLKRLLNPHLYRLNINAVLYVKSV